MGTGRLLIVAALICSGGAWAQQEVTGHPLVTPYDGSQGGGEYWEYNRYDLIVGFDFEVREAVTERIEGRVTRLYYESPDERSELEIFTNYRLALEEAGFEEIWSCAGDGSCTTGSTRNRFHQANGIRAINGPNSHYAVGTLGYEDRLAYVAVATGRHGTSIDIIETAEMDTGMVAVSAEALADGLDADGHVRVDGLLFAHDSDELLAESAAALDALHSLLLNRPNLNLYVVGHTDMTGSLSYNLDLSRRRAASVISALVDDYGIDPSRLEPQGVGPLAPEATNATEAGRTHNRRVEIVVR
ncbi:OmpA family protein [Hyphobacterium sp.]|uniref:OmpA family protein n=1 Tax=Hyphobacterium sp. TaxID=2004662 RepID=UPI003BA9F673